MVEQDRSQTKRSDQMYFTLLLGGVILLSFWIRFIYLHNFPWGYDEGIHVLLAMLLAANYAPYSDLFVSYPPLFVWSLEWPWRIWGSVEAIRLYMTFYALLGIAGVGVMAYRLAGKLAGVLAALFLSLSITYLDGSRAVMTEVPSVGVAALAVALAAMYYWSGRRTWLLASGVAMSASLMLKVLSPFVLGLVPLMLLVRQFKIRYSPENTQPLEPIAGLKNLAIDGLIWGIGLVAPLLFTLLLYDAKAMYRQVIAFRIATRAEYREDWKENVEILFLFGRSNIPLILAAAWGTGIILLKKWQSGWFILLWLVLAVVFSLLQVPLREKHLPLLLPSIAVLASLGLADGLKHITQVGRHPGNSTIIMSSAVASLLILGYFWQLKTEFSSFSHTIATPLNDNDRMLAEYLQQYTAPNDCLVTDNPTLAFFSKRLVPPNLSEVSSARLRSGYLTYDELVSATTTYNCQVVAPVATRLKRTRPDFVEWSKQNFVGLWLYDGSTEILLAQPLTNPQPDHTLQMTLGEQVELVGFDEIETTDAVYISLYWHALRPLAEDYAIFVHVRDEFNNTIINGDHQPYNNLVPTTRWPVGKIIKETIRMDLPPDLPKGEYRIMVGLYSPSTGERLSVQNDTSGESAVALSTLYIVPPK